MDSLRMWLRGVAIGIPIVLAGCAYYGGIEERPSWSFTTHTHFGLSVQVRRSILLGDLEDARAAARRVESHPTPPSAPAGLLGYLDATREAAATVANAGTLDEAASGAAYMARTCGECHVAGRVGPRYVLGDPAPVSEERGHPVEYTWAIVRLWQALVAPSDSAWSRGVGTLQDLPFAAATMARLGSPAGGAPALAARFRELADRAAANPGPDERVEIVAGFLAGCGRCHQGGP